MAHFFSSIKGKGFNENLICFGERILAVTVAFG